MKITRTEKGYYIAQWNGYVTIGKTRPEAMFAMWLLMWEKRKK